MTDDDVDHVGAAHVELAVALALVRREEEDCTGSGPRMQMKPGLSDALLQTLR